MRPYSEFEDPIDLYMDGCFIGRAKITVKHRTVTTDYIKGSLPIVQWTKAEFHINDFERAD